MQESETVNSAQVGIWNGPAGAAWVERQALLDTLFASLVPLLTDLAAERPDQPLLDIGCGTGATTLAAAKAIAGRARCTGIDISKPMLELASVRAREEGLDAEFLLADAQTHPFAGESFGTLISRFGVMFFDDRIAAFSNLRRAAREGARMRWACRKFSWLTAC